MGHPTLGCPLLIFRRQEERGGAPSYTKKEEAWHFFVGHGLFMVKGRCGMRINRHMGSGSWLSPIPNRIHEFCSNSN